MLVGNFHLVQQVSSVSCHLSRTDLFSCCASLSFMMCSFSFSVFQHLPSCSETTCFYLVHHELTFCFAQHKPQQLCVPVAPPRTDSRRKEALLIHTVSGNPCAISHSMSGKAHTNMPDNAHTQMQRRRRFLRFPIHAMSDLPCTISHSVRDQPPPPARRQLKQRNYICLCSGQLSMHDLSHCAKAPLCTHHCRNASLHFHTLQGCPCRFPHSLRS